jgi:hypothetical protein
MLTLEEIPYLSANEIYFWLSNWLYERLEVATIECYLPDGGNLI